MPAEYAEQCPVLCNADPALANVVNDAADCAALVGMVSQGEPVLEALCAEPPMGLTCEQVCTRIGRDCIPGGGSPQEIAQCAQACNADMPTPAQLQCGLTAECNDVEACEDLQDPQATCEQVCARIGRDCIPGGGSPQEIAQCAQACNADMPTPAQLQCGLTAQCNDVQACQVL